MLLISCFLVFKNRSCVEGDYFLFWWFFSNWIEIGGNCVVELEG